VRKSLGDGGGRERSPNIIVAKSTDVQTYLLLAHGNLYFTNYMETPQALVLSVRGDRNLGHFTCEVRASKDGLEASKIM
jgi:hypothetical protein